MKIPRSHPRYDSLSRREKLIKGFREGYVAPQGLIAQGRGEAFDYLLGERTSKPALLAERAAAAYLVAAEKPMISVNGNAAALAAKDLVRLARIVPAGLEVNLFHRTTGRVRTIEGILRKAGATHVLGSNPDARIPGLHSKRALCIRDGIYSADVVLVPLEDGDRTEALVRMGKIVIAVDLNPLSRTSRAATVPIVDELSRALKNISSFVEDLRKRPRQAAQVRESFDSAGNLRETQRFIGRRLKKLS